MGTQDQVRIYVRTNGARDDQRQGGSRTVGSEEVELDGTLKGRWTKAYRDTSRIHTSALTSKGKTGENVWRGNHFEHIANGGNHSASKQEGQQGMGDSNQNSR